MTPTVAGRRSPPPRELTARETAVLRMLAFSIRDAFDAGQSQLCDHGALSDFLRKRRRAMTNILRPARRAKG